MLIPTLFIFTSHHLTPFIPQTARFTLHRFTLHHPHAASPENQPDTLVFGFCRKADFPLMLFFLMLHHPPLFLLKLSPTSFISMLHHPHAASPETQTDTLVFRFIRRSTAGRTSIPLFGELLQTELPQRTLLLIARFGFSVMLIYTLFIFMLLYFTPLILTTSRLTLYRFTSFILITFRLTLHRLTLFILTPHRLKINPIHYRFALSGEAPPAA